MGENRVTTYTGSHLGQEGLLAQLGSWQMPFAKVIDLCQVGLLLLCFHVYHWVTFLPKIPTQKFLFFLNQLSTFLKHVFRWFSDNFILVFSSYSPSITFFLPFLLILFLLTPPNKVSPSFMSFHGCVSVFVSVCLSVFVCQCIRWCDQKRSNEDCLYECDWEDY